MKQLDTHRYGGERDPEGSRGGGSRGIRGAHRGGGFSEGGIGSGPGGFGRGGGGRRRMFDGGELRLVLLRLMQAQPRHGYDLIREIETRTGGAYAPSPGIVYPSLTMLEDLGQIEAAASEGAKRLFSLTSAGAALLDERGGEADAALARLDALKTDAVGLETGPIFRAMHNLKAVLEQRLSAATDKETLFTVVDVIDEAARKIERL